MSHESMSHELSYESGQRFCLEPFRSCEPSDIWFAVYRTCRAPARLWLAVIDFQNGEQRSRSEEANKFIVYSRFINIPLG